MVRRGDMDILVQEDIDQIVTTSGNCGVARQGGLVTWRAVGRVVHFLPSLKNRLYVALPDPWPWNMELIVP